MKKFTLILVLLFLVAASASGQKPAPQDTSKGFPIAVVAAVEFYSAGWAWRPDAIKDANKIAWILSTGGYDVRRLYGKMATRENIMDALDKATDDAGENGQVIFYFSGHGIKSKSDPNGSYVAPYGAQVGQDEDLMNVETIRSAVLDYIRNENALFIFDTGSTLKNPNKDYGTILELATALKQGLDGAADNNNNGRVEFVELAKHIRPKVKNVKIEARPAEEVYITEQEVVVISKKVKKKKKKSRASVERMRPDQFDQLLEQKMEEKMQMLKEVDQKMRDVERMLEDPRRLPLPR